MSSGSQETRAELLGELAREFRQWTSLGASFFRAAAEHLGIEQLLKYRHAAILIETNVRFSFREGGMKKSQTLQTLSFPIRLPTAAQADALRLLDVAREVINATIVALWSRLDEFGTQGTRYAYKQVSAFIISCDPHGDRQWRCEAEQAGRILRGLTVTDMQVMDLLASQRPQA